MTKIRTQSYYEQEWFEIQDHESIQFLAERIWKPYQEEIGFRARGKRSSDYLKRQRQTVDNWDHIWVVMTEGQVHQSPVSGFDSSVVLEQKLQSYVSHILDAVRYQARNFHWEIQVS